MGPRAEGVQGGEQGAGEAGSSGEPRGFVRCVCSLGLSWIAGVLEEKLVLAAPALSTQHPVTD